MDGQSTTHIHRDDLRPAALAGDLITVLVGLLLALECVIAGVLLVRRAQGALALTASPGWLIAWMTLAVAAAAATRLSVGRHAGTHTGITASARYLPAAALILTALTLTSFRAPWVVFLIWAMVAVEEGAVRLVLRDGLSGTLDRIGLRGPHRWPGVRAPFKPGTGAPEGDEPPPAETAGLSPARLNLAGGDRTTSTTQFSQRLERVRSMGGTDLLAGTLTARFAPGQVTAHVHVAFCPPFPRVPQLEFRQVAGPPARIKAGQTLPHGVRFDVRLEGPSTESATLCLEVRATHPGEPVEPAPGGNPASNQ